MSGERGKGDGESREEMDDEGREKRERVNGPWTKGERKEGESR